MSLPLIQSEPRPSGEGKERRRAEGGKSNLPGWRIEQRYSQGVLIGNWSEDRLGKFPRGNEFGDSTSRRSYQQYSPLAYQPDATTRRSGVLRNYGLGKAHIFVHHGKRYMHNNISSYDQEFCRSRHSEAGKCWDRHQLAWGPEASDNPLIGPPTRYGLKEAVEEKVRKLKELEARGDFHSTYSTSFRSPTPDQASSLPRYATPRHLSSHLHPHHIHHHLHLRGKPLAIVPETIDHSVLPNRLSATV